MTYILIGIGGALGSLLRYQLGKTISKKSDNNFPLGTFLINISGAFLLGILTSFELNENLIAFFGIGFLGAYTTFSTFMYEGFNLCKKNPKRNALIYILGSILIGIIGFTLGYGIIYIIK